MDHRELNEAIKKGELNNLYLFYGEENFTKERSLKRIMELYAGGFPELNITVFQESAGEDEIVAALEALPMFSDKRLVVIKDCPALMSKGADMPKVTKAVEQLMDTTMAIFYMRNKADGKRTLTKALKPHMVEFGRLKESEITQYLRIDGRRRGVKWEGGAMERLIFNVGDEMSSIALEAEKLYAACENGCITMEDVDRYCTKNITSNVFSMMDLVLRGRMLEANEKLEEILADGEQPVMLLGGIAYRVRGLSIAKAAKRGEITQQEAIKRLRGSRYFFQNATKEASKYTKSQIDGALKAITEAEFMIKSGQMRDKTAVMTAIFAIFAAGRERT
ncbi:MAG: DNA polymerase III subunit delta [Clostridiales bacterium]|nr:DNA polymerase III subunit delta [Clostridiales bacterium]